MYVWNWEKNEHMLLTKCKQNNSFNKFCLNTKANEEFKPNQNFKYPINKEAEHEIQKKKLERKRKLVEKDKENFIY